MLLKEMNNSKKFKHVDIILLSTVVIATVTGIGTYSLKNIVFVEAEPEKQFILKLENVLTTLNVTEFKFSQGNEICKSGNCEFKIEEIVFLPPNDDNYIASYSMDFRVIDNITNKNLSKLKKDFVEKFYSSSYCNTDDIVKNEKGNEVYQCSDTSVQMLREYGDQRWLYNSTGIYDPIEQTFTIKGDFKGYTY